MNARAVQLIKLRCDQNPWEVPQERGCSGVHATSETEKDLREYLVDHGVKRAYIFGYNDHKNILYVINNVGNITPFNQYNNTAEYVFCTDECPCPVYGEAKEVRRDVDIRDRENQNPMIGGWPKPCESCDDRRDNRHERREERREDRDGRDSIFDRKDERRIFENNNRVDVRGGRFDERVQVTALGVKDNVIIKKVVVEDGEESSKRGYPVRRERRVRPCRDGKCESRSNSDSCSRSEERECRRCDDDSCSDDRRRKCRTFPKVMRRCFKGRTDRCHKKCPPLVADAFITIRNFKLDFEKFKKRNEVLVEIRSRRTEDMLRRFVLNKDGKIIGNDGRLIPYFLPRCFRSPKDLIRLAKCVEKRFRGKKVCYYVNERCCGFVLIDGRMYQVIIKRGGKLAFREIKGRKLRNLIKCGLYGVEFGPIRCN